MEATLDVEHRTRGADLLLYHCTMLARPEEPRPPATVRLEQALGSDLTRLLLFALARGQDRRGRRGSSSP